MIILLAILVFASKDKLLNPIVGGEQLEPAPPAAQPTGQMQVADISLFRSTDAPDAVVASTPSEPAKTKPRRGKIVANSSLYLELRKMDITPQDIDGIVRASRKTYNLKRVRPGQRFDVYADSNNRLDSLAFYINSEQHLIVRRGVEDTFRAGIEDIPFTTTYHMTHGTITSSIFQSLSAHKAEKELAGALDQIFGWSINFFSDIRQGDTYTILYERKEFEDGSSALGEILAARVVNKGQAHHAFRFKPGGGEASYFDIDGRSMQKSLRRSPLKFNKITSRFSGRRFHPVYKTYKPHYGVDFGAPRGTPVYATGAGTVLTAGRRGGNGNYVKIQHNATYTTYYLHLNGFARGIRSGTKVEQGQLIGYVGSTGAATAPHVCYRIKRNGSWVNPSNLRLPSKDPVPASDMLAFERVRDTYLYGVQQALQAGLANETKVVRRPTHPAPDHVETVF